MHRGPILPLMVLCMTLAALLGIGCARSEGCPDNEHLYSGRCVCNFGYIRILASCVPAGNNTVDGDSESPDIQTDSDIDTDTLDRIDRDSDPDSDPADVDADTPAEQDLPNTGTCFDPYPLSIGVPFALDFEESHDQIRHPCLILDAGIDWNGPDHVFGFTFDFDMLQNSPRFEVVVTPQENTRMIYTTYMYYDVSGWGVEVCDFADVNTYCIAQQGFTVGTGNPMTVAFGEQDIDPRSGDIVYIVVDTVDDENYPPGPYTIEVRQLPCEPETRRCSTIGEAIEECSAQHVWEVIQQCEEGQDCTEDQGAFSCAATAAGSTP